MCNAMLPDLDSMGFVHRTPIQIANDIVTLALREGHDEILDYYHVLCSAHRQAYSWCPAQLIDETTGEVYNAELEYTSQSGNRHRIRWLIVDDEFVRLT